MTSLSAKTLALAAVVALGSLLSTTAHAAIVRTVEGAPVLTNEGGCVINNWEGEEGCDAAKAAAGGGQVAAEAADKVVHTEAVVYFDFNKSSLTPKAKKTLSDLAKRVKGHKELVVGVVGYADRLGKADYNDKLAMKRAQTVEAYLRAQGVKAKKIEVRSLGKTAPKANCPADLPRKKMIECLQEDRRVEVEIGGKMPAPVAEKAPVHGKKHHGHHHHHAEKPAAK